MEWLSASEAAERLGVSDVRVRQLAASGELLARRHSAGWLIAEEAVEARRQSPRGAGRPLKPENAWLLLSVLADASRVLVQRGDVPKREHHAEALLLLRCSAAQGRLPTELARARAEGVGDDARLLSAIWWRPFEETDQAHRRNLKRGLGHAVRSAPELARWQQWLAQRSHSRRYWAHPGVVDHLRNDARLSVGGAWAAALAGADITPDDKLELYVREDDRDDVIKNYRLQPDPTGKVTLRSVPRGVPDAVTPRPSEPVAPVIAALDLLDSSDARSREIGKSLLEDTRKLLTAVADQNEREKSRRKKVIAK